MNKFLVLVFFIISVKMANAQPLNYLKTENDSVIEDSLSVVTPNNSIINSELLDVFYSKLSTIKQAKGSKLNIVHIGDSHIQGDAMTGKVRQILQQNFGNAGRGFVFPHRLARTNGAHDVQFKSNAIWKSYRNIYPITEQQVGLSGIAMATKNDNFYIELNSSSESNLFTKVKILTPKNDNSIGIASEKITVSEQILVPKKIVHRVKRGETLSGLADKYNISIEVLKKANRIKKNKIQKGIVLKIPTSEMVVKTISKYKFIPLPTVQDDYCSSYKSEVPLNNVFLVANKAHDYYNLNGIVLENDQAGILYHNIGVNGAKYLDFNKYDLFFEQLKALNPDLIVVSLGTNESFGKISVENFMSQMQLFLQNISTQIGNVPVILTTPPPSLFKKKNVNTIVFNYTQKLLEVSLGKQFAVWNMFEQMGGLYSVNRNYAAGLIAADKIHYTNLGYEKQGVLFTEALLRGYENFLKK